MHPAGEAGVDFSLAPETALSYADLDQLQQSIRRHMSRYLIAYGPIGDVANSCVDEWAEALGRVFDLAGDLDGLWRYPGKPVDLFALKAGCATPGLTRARADQALAGLRDMEAQDRRDAWTAGSFAPNLRHLKLAAVELVNFHLGLCADASVIRGATGATGTAEATDATDAADAVDASGVTDVSGAAGAGGAGAAAGNAGRARGG